MQSNKNEVEVGLMQCDKSYVMGRYMTVHLRTRINDSNLRY